MDEGRGARGDTWSQVEGMRGARACRGARSAAASARCVALGLGRRAGGDRRGFTLLEVMLVIALMAVAGTMFVVSMESLGKSSPADEFEGAFWKAMAMGRDRALTSRRTVELRWDEETKSFMVEGSGGKASVPVPAEANAKDRECEAVFSEEVAANDFILVRGELVTRRPAAAVRIFPDGSCQAFAVEFKLGDYKHRVIIDPWTGAEMLSTDAAKKGGRS